MSAAAYAEQKFDKNSRITLPNGHVESVTSMYDTVKKRKHSTF
jgi:hypothetical protein